MLPLLAVLPMVVALQGTPETSGPWRQLIQFRPSADHAAGLSLWVRDADIAVADSPPSTEARQVTELWVVHGPRVGGQAYMLQSSLYDCDQGGYQLQSVSAFTRQGALLGAATGDGQSRPTLPHSAENLVWDAVCDDTPSARRGQTVATVAAAVGQTEDFDDAAPAATEARVDMDHDGRPDVVRVAMRPHSMRHDVEIVPETTPNRVINIVAAEQPPTGALVQRSLRPLERDYYLTACEMKEGRDIDPCQPAYSLAQEGVEVIGDRGPSILVWLEAGEPRVFRLPSIED